MNDSRRRFLRYIAASPLLAHVRAQGPPVTLSTAKDALTVMDFEELARKALPPAHLGYMASGVDDDLTLRANMAAFKRIQLRPRRLVDVSKVDTSIELFGTTWESPIFLCPVGGQKMFNPDGEVAVARAAKSKNALQVLSTVTTYSVEDVAKALGRPPWFQLYMPTSWDATEKIVRRVEECGCQALAWTVDLLGGRNTETSERYRRQDTRNCMECHTNNRGGRPPEALPMFKGLEPSYNPSSATWEYFDRLRKMTKMKLLLKGLDNREDARLAREHGADGIIVSNHGGRAAETLRATIECLPEVVDAAGGQIPVLVDGGFRRGTDVYKALALGARAVGVGRPYIYGLTAFGQAGVEQVIDMLRAELTLTMRQCGTPSTKQITRASVILPDSHA
jgi:isopentenyl diphosphate isomerase/L-lactate dehydrogenase-like FMN-dependent dehydrogenase